MRSGAVGDRDRAVGDTAAADAASIVAERQVDRARARGPAANTSGVRASMTTMSRAPAREVVVDITAVGLDGEAVGEVGDRGVGGGRLDRCGCGRVVWSVWLMASPSTRRPPRHQRPECRRPSILRQEI